MPMADDDSKPNRRTAQPPRKPEPEALEEIHELPDFPDREEFVRTAEMAGVGRDYFTTQRYDIPDAIMELARRSQIVESESESEWVEVSVEVRGDGSIVLPEELRKRLAKRAAVTVRVKIE